MDNKKVPSWRAVIVNILATYGLKWLWVTIITTILVAVLAGSVTDPSLPLFSATATLLENFGLWQYFAASPGLALFMLLFFAPVIEEALFRMLPLTLVQNSRPQVIRAVLIAVCGIIFGWIHGSPLNVFVQGVGGIMLGCLYLANARSQFTSYISCVLVHAMYNLTVILVALK